MSLRLLKCALLASACSFLLTACWDIKDPQDINYLTALGFDYADNRYVVYTQMIDFTSMANIASGKSTQPVPVWIGEGKGATVGSAINQIYDASQMRIFYGHINAIVLSENMLKKDLAPIMDFLNRYYELRYTPWVFSTSIPIDRIFAATPFFSLSPYMSLLHQPMEVYKQKSTIKPIMMREFIQTLNEPGKAVLLPSLKLENSVWKKGTEQKDKLTVTPSHFLAIDGIRPLVRGNFKGFLPQNKVMGLRWVQQHTNRSPLLIKKHGEPQAELSLEKPKVKIISSVRNEQAEYELQVKLSGNIIHDIEALPEAEMERIAAEQVRAEIQETFEEGLTLHADLLGLEHALYQQNHRQWKRLQSMDRLKLTKNSLKIQVSVDLIYSGKLKVITKD